MLIQAAGSCFSFWWLPFCARCRKSNRSSSLSAIIAKTSEYPSRVVLAVPVRPVQNCSVLVAPSSILRQSRVAEDPELQRGPCRWIRWCQSIRQELCSLSPNYSNNPGSTFVAQVILHQFLRGGGSLRCSSRTSRCRQTGAGRFACPGC